MFSLKTNIARFLIAVTFLARQLIRSELIRTKETVSPKKFTSNLILRVLKSEKFKNELKQYLAEIFVKETSNETNKKLYKLCVSWQSIVIKVEFYMFQQVCKSIEEDRKTKLPWSFIEITGAVDSFNQQYMNN